MTSTTCENVCRKLFDFNQDIIDTAVDQWCDHLRSRGRASGGHCEHMF